MNIYSPITDTADVNMTSKGQVLIPKAIRDRVGLVPGAAVTVGINDRGEAVVLPVGQARWANETPEDRKARIRAAIESIAGKYALDQSTDDYMAEIRGPYDDLP
jgi:AbrB family looped-hinge helix DNA binding protein